VIAGLVVALHPLLLMYAGRAMIEPLSILLFTATMLAAVRAARHGRAGDFASLGLLIGLAALTKGIFLLLLLLPLLVRLLRDRDLPVRRAGVKYATTLLLTLLVIVPWTWRNYYISGSIVPVQILDGVNFAVGDYLAENWDASPIAYGPIVDGFPYPDFRGATVDMMAAPAGVTVAYDREMRARSLERYREEPGFLLKKMALQSVTFWGLWSSSYATLFAGGMQVALLLLFLWAGHRVRRDGGWRDRRLIPFWGVWLYVLPHLPLFAIGRYSVVVIPTMIALLAASKRH
jgi:4-amino-4-deoxy-L-arabinose transferase-like glycosyltransferase